MKTPDEIKKALECCFYDSAQCGECPYYPVSCDRELVRDAREYIRQLEADNEKYQQAADECCYKSRCNQEINQLEALCRRFREEKEQLEAENDRLKDDVCREYNIQDELKERIQQLEAERDAAVKDLAYIAFFADGNACDYCDQTDCENGCALADKNIGFKWRGVQKEE